MLNDPLRERVCYPNLLRDRQAGMDVRDFGSSLRLFIVP